jgi:periplasmic mercuric ion binding protein
MLKPSFLSLGLASALTLGLLTTAHAAPRVVTLDVSGMTCITCPVTVKKALSRVDGVTSVDVDFKRKQASVVYDDAMTTADALTRATADAGFPSTAQPPEATQ